MALALNSLGQFVSTDDTGVTKMLGVIAKQSRTGRWQYRDADSGHLYASGMEPDAFAKKFWFRDDYMLKV